MFTGRRFDLETGLYYYRARYYNPQIGRFLQTDPIGYSNGINWYKYCLNNPVRYIDITGMEPIDPVDAWLNGSEEDFPIRNIAVVSPDVPLSWRLLGLGINQGGAPSYPVAPGQKWTINDFFNWYRYAPDDPLRDGWGASVDLANIGLLEDFQKHEAVSGIIADIQNTARNKAMAMATDLKQKWETFYAMANEGKLGSEAPPMWLSEKYDEQKAYDFAPNPTISTLLDDTLLVFGNGILKAHVSIGVGWLGESSAWGVYITWEVEDSFSDPESNDTEWKYCRPYMLTGKWSWWAGGFI